MSLRSKVIRLAYANPDLRAHALALLTRTADEGEDAEPGGGGGKPSGKFIKFLEEEGDDRVRNPDTGNDVKVKSLKGPKGKKLVNELFRRWLDSQDEPKPKPSKTDKGEGEKKKTTLKDLTSDDRDSLYEWANGDPEDFLSSKNIKKHGEDWTKWPADVLAKEYADSAPEGTLTSLRKQGVGDAGLKELLVSAVVAKKPPKPKEEAPKPKPKPKEEAPKPKEEAPKPKPKPKEEAPSKRAKFPPNDKAAWNALGEKLGEGRAKWAPETRSAVKAYTTENYKAVNGYLRDPDTAPTFKVPKAKKGEAEATAKSAKQVIEELDKLFDSDAARTKEPVMVARGISKSNVLTKLLKSGDLQVGAEIEDPGYISTSVKPWEAHDWKSVVKLNIHVPEGARAVYVGPPPSGKDAVSDVPDEYELLLDRGTKLKVTRIDAEKGTIDVEVVVGGRAKGKPEEAGGKKAASMHRDAGKPSKFVYDDDAVIIRGPDGKVIKPKPEGKKPKDEPKPKGKPKPKGRERAAMIRQAAVLPVGDPERLALLAVLTAGGEQG